MIKKPYGGAFIQNSKKICPRQIFFVFRIAGFIAYGIDQKSNTCYHKCFSKKVDTDILSEIINKSFNEHDFPELQQAVLSSRTTKPNAFQVTTAKIEIDPIFGNVMIEDPEIELRIELFKVESS